MGRINSIFAAVAAMAMSRMGGTHRTAADTKRGRQMVSVQVKRSRSKYRPHIGKKEQERAKRCYMHPTFCTWETWHVPLHPRCSPVMHQMSKQEHAALTA